MSTKCEPHFLYLTMMWLALRAGLRTIYALQGVTTHTGVKILILETNSELITI